MRMLYLLRHGQTSYNVEHRLQGQIDIPLSDVGRQQAEKLGEWFSHKGPKLDRIYCSKLERAGETARIIGGYLGITPITVFGIEEIFFGCFQGHTFEECARLYPEQYAEFLLRGTNTHGGETGKQVFERARAALLKLREAESGSALVVCHGAVIGYLRAALMGKRFEDAGELIPDNGQIVSFSEANMRKLREYKV